MSKGINKVILVGNLGKDPESRFTGDGNQVVNLALATSESWKDKKSGELKEATEWHKVVLFGKVAEIAAEYLKKGSKVYIEGKLKTNKFTDKNGIDKYSTEIIGSEMQMLSKIEKSENTIEWSNKTNTVPDDFVDSDIPF